MMGASALSGICYVATTSLLNHGELDTTKFGVGRSINAAADVNFNNRIGDCGMESASSPCVSTSEQARRVLVAMHVKNPSNGYRKLHKRPSVKKVGKSSSSHVSTSSSSRLVRSPDLSASFEKVAKQQPKPSEKWGMDLQVGVTEDTRRQKRRASLAALAAAGYVSLLHPSTTSATELLRVDFPAPMMTIEALEAQFKGSIRNELENEVQVQRKVWGITNVSTTAPSPSQSQQSQSIAAVSTQEVGSTAHELVQNIEEDAFQAWKQVQKELELEGEKSAVPVTRPAPPKSPVKKVVAASVAVAVAGSVAGAATTAGRAVASTGGTVVATSLTALQQSPLPVSRFLAKIVSHLGGGGVAGAVGATVVYPLDTIKTRMQAQNMEGDEPQYKDEIDCFKQLVAKEGPASLYSGLVPQLLGIAPEKAMKLTVNEALLGSLETMMPGARLWALEFIAGGGGGASQVVFTNPMEIVKVRLQTQKEGTPKKTLWTIVKELGVGGLYEGAGVTLARDVPSSAIFFAIYTLLRQLYPEQSFLAGAVAAIPATVLVTPMDIIKTRLQKEPAPGEPQYTDWWQCLQDIVNKEGPQALFKGSLLRVLRTSPQFGITLMLYRIMCDG